MLNATLHRNWDPWRELGRLPVEMNRIFAELSDAARTEYPAVNVWSGEDKLVVTAELPGVDPALLDVTVDRDVLTIEGSRETEDLSEGGAFHRRERKTGKFSRRLKLPFEVDSSLTEAEYEQGVLNLVLHKPEANKPKKIVVKTAS